MLGAGVQASGTRWDNAANTRKLGGYALINLNAQYKISRDLKKIARQLRVPAEPRDQFGPPAAAFGSSQVWSLRPTREGNTVVVAGQGVTVPSREVLVQRAATIEQRFGSLGLGAKAWLADGRLLHADPMPATLAASEHVRSSRFTVATPELPGGAWRLGHPPCPWD